MDKYAIYLRKSRADLELEAIGKFETLRLHEERLTALAEKKQLVVFEVFRELVSGDSIASRPEMQRLLEKVRAGVFKGVLVTEVSRLARGDGIDQGTVSQAFRESGTLIITPEKVYDPTSPLDEDFFDFSLFMARQEYKFIRRRMMSAKNQLREQGYWIVSLPPFGYEKKDKRTLVPVEPAASFVRWAFVQRAAGASYYSIFSRAQSEGFLESLTSVKRMLTNPAYKGILKRRGRPDVPGVWEPLVSPELWDAVQDAPDRPRIHKSMELKDPLAGLLVCPVCGLGMRRSSNKGQAPEYRHVRPVRCGVSSARVWVVIDALADALKGVLADDEISVSQSVELPDLDRLNARLSSLKSQLSRAYEAYESGVYTLEEFASRREDLKTQIADQEKTIKDAEDLSANAGRTEVFRMSVAEALADLKDWKNQDVEALNLFLKSFIKEIRYNRPSRYDPVDLEVVFK